MSHSQGMLTCLVRALLAQVDDDVGRSGVQGVEVGPMLPVQTLDGEVVYAPKPLHQFPAINNIKKLGCRRNSAYARGLEVKCLIKKEYSSSL